MKKTVVSCGGIILADSVRKADTFYSRFIGLMGKKSLSEGEGLLLNSCSSIHCFFMKITIDAVYLSDDYKVLGVETLRPWSIGRFFKNTSHVLELKAGAARVSKGDVLNIE